MLSKGNAGKTRILAGVRRVRTKDRYFCGCEIDQELKQSLKIAAHRLGVSEGAVLRIILTQSLTPTKQNTTCYGTLTEPIEQ